MTDHTFEKGYYCKADNLRLNDEQENRKGQCEIVDAWRKCDECVYFGNIEERR